MDEIKIEPSAELQDGFKIGVFLELIFSVAFVYKFGLQTLLIVVVFNVLSLFYIRGDLYRITFNQENIIFYPTKKIYKIFSWNEMKTIKYIKYNKGIKKYECIYFSTRKFSKLRFMNKVFFGGIDNNSFYVNLVDNTNFAICCSFPKYEFLNKLKEWGVNIEIDEKFLKQDYSLRKYVSNNEIKSEQTIQDISNTVNEWIINQNNTSHIIKVDEYDNFYHIIVDNENIKVLDKKKVRRWGIEVVIQFNNEKYQLVYENRKFCIVKNHKYLDNNKLYIPRIMDWIVLVLGAGLLITCVVIRMFNLFPNKIDTIILMLSVTSVIIMGAFRYIKHK